MKLMSLVIKFEANFKTGDAVTFIRRIALKGDTP